jgi:hypothetical protein
MSDKQQTARYALFKDGVQVSKAHSTRYAVEIEAFEAKLAVKTESYKMIADGVEIREVP